MGMQRRTGATSAQAAKDDFTDGGTAREIADAWVPTRRGEAIIGKLVRVTDIVTKVSRAGEKAPLAEFGPVVIRDADGHKTAARSCAVMLSASLRLRISRERDLGRVFALVYEGKEDSAKGQMHVYNVVEQSNEKLVAALRAAGWEAGEDDLPF